MVGAISSILFMNSRPIDVAIVTEKLKKFSDNLNRDAASANKVASLTYGAVEMKGVGYEKFVEINQPHLTLGRNDAPDAGWTLDTGKVSVNYDPVNDKRFVFKFGDPLTVTHNGKKTTLTFEKPLKVGYFLKDLKAPQSDSLITIRMPTQIAIDSGTLVNGKSSATNLLFEALPEISIKNTVGTKTKEENFEFRNITVQSGGEDNANIGAVANSLNEKAIDDHKYEGTFNFTVSDLTHHLDNKQTATCSLTTNIGYTSTESLTGLVGLPVKADINAKLNKMVLACDDFTIKIDGDVASLSGDDMLSGAVTINIDNPEAFLASELVSTQTRGTLAAAFPKITGQPFDPKTPLNFSVKREKGGTLMFGAVSLADSGINLSDLMAGGIGKTLEAGGAAEKSPESPNESGMFPESSAESPQSLPLESPQNIPATSQESPK